MSSNLLVFHEKLAPPIDHFAGVLYAIRAGQRGKWADQGGIISATAAWRLAGV
jgi:hypothetical protein